MMFLKRKPIELKPKSTTGVVPEGPAVTAARSKVEEMKAAIGDAESRRAALAAELQDAERRATQATFERNEAEASIRRVALGEDIPHRTAEDLAELIGEQAKAERELAQARQRITAEDTRLAGEITALRTRIVEAEHAIDKARFEELVAAYIAAIKPAIPIARALREAAKPVHRNCDEQPILINPDDNYGGQLFGVAI